MTGEEDQKKRKERKTEFIPLRCLPILFFIFNILYTFYRTLKSYKQKRPHSELKSDCPPRRRKKIHRPHLFLSLISGLPLQKRHKTVFPQPNYLLKMAASRLLG